MPRMTVKMNFNPNFKEDVMKAAQEKLSSELNAKVILVTDKEALQALERKEQLSQGWLENLSNRGLIEVRSTRNLDSQPGEQDLLFMFVTEQGKRVLEGK
jgi:hypothetical protein